MEVGWRERAGDRGGEGGHARVSHATLLIKVMILQVLFLDLPSILLMASLSLLCMRACLCVCVHVHSRILLNKLLPSAATVKYVRTQSSCIKNDLRIRAVNAHKSFYSLQEITWLMSVSPMESMKKDKYNIAPI